MPNVLILSLNMSRLPLWKWHTTNWHQFFHFLRPLSMWWALPPGHYTQSSQTASSFVLSLFMSIQTRVRGNNGRRPSAEPADAMENNLLHRLKIIDITQTWLWFDRRVLGTCEWACHLHPSPLSCNCLFQIGGQKVCRVNCSGHSTTTHSKTSLSEETTLTGQQSIY